MKRRGSETVTVTRRVSGLHADSTAGTSFDVDGCSVLPDTVDLETQNFEQDTSAITFTVIFPTGTDVRPSDMVTVRGVVYDVEGIPVVLRSAITGNDAGLQVKVGAITG